MEKSGPSSLPTRFVRQLRKRPILCLILIFLAVWVFAAIINYFRLPQNYRYANFFAEDGQHFAQNILDHGFFAALFTTFNGYFIGGIYLLTGIGFVVNHIFLGGYFINLPNAFALTSYAFLGLCAALPILLLRNYLRLPYRIALSLLICFLPMPSFDYGTIGTIGNLKFAFTYIAFLLVLYRIRLPRSSKLILLTDLGLLVCVYTIAEAYVVLPFILLADGLHVKQLVKRSQWRTVFRRDNIALWSFVGLITLALVQVVIVVIRGVPNLPGYLDDPYQMSKTIEIFLGRVLLYPFVTAGYHHLSNARVVFLLIIGLLLALKFGRKKQYIIYGFGLFTILVATAIFVFNRTGVSIYYNHYQGTGFDNFFYPQNYIALTLGVLILADMLRRLDWKIGLSIAMALCTLVLAGEVYTNSTYASNDFMPYQIGTLKQQAQVICQDPHGPANVRLIVYPFTFLGILEPRGRVCNVPANELQIGLQSFGLTSTASDALNIASGQATFTQTFVASQNNLNGLAVYLSTYAQTRVKDYRLTLKDATCRQSLRQANIPLRVHDNAFQQINFRPIANSKNQAFCFSITPTSRIAQPFALQLSQETSYSVGLLTINGRPNTKDIVFQAIYK